jgi:perosamine synthetase
MMISHSKPTIGHLEAEASKDVLLSGQLVQGKFVQTLERDFAAYDGSTSSVAVGHATQAISLILRSLSSRPILVGVPSYACRALYDAVVSSNCIPVVVDIDPKTLGPSVDDLARAGAAVVIVPHLFGVRVPIESYLAIGLTVIEDCAQRMPHAQQARTEVKGSFRVYSFEATKFITAGEGGMVTSDDDDLIQYIRYARNPDYSSSRYATKSTMTEMQAAIAGVQLHRLSEFVDRRRDVAHRYLSYFSGRGWSGLVHPLMRSADNVFFRFVVEVDDAQRYVDAGQRYEVNFRRPVAPFGLHSLFGKEGAFEETERALWSLLSFPIYPSLSDNDVARVWEVFEAIHADIGEPAH